MSHKMNDSKLFAWKPSFSIEAQETNKQKIPSEHLFIQIETVPETIF